MNQALNTAWIGFGWGQDLSIDGGALTDAYSVTIHRARPGGGNFAWTGAPDADGTLRVRIDGKDTATWAAGLLPVSIRIQRGDASGIVANLPPLVVKMPAVSADGSEPLISDRGKPLSLQLTGSDRGQVSVRLEAGMKGDKGDKGDTGDLTPALVAARDLAVASASSSSADALATANDRAATASDRAQVRIDRIEVADDRTRTAADRAATAADRVQVAQDFFAVAGLRDEAETLRDSASGHRAAAQAAAQASQSNRDATAADRVQTGQDRTQTGADRTQTGQDRAQTTDDRRQTGEDRTASANSASAAAKFDPALYVRKDGSTGIVQIGTTNANNGALRLARRSSGFSTSIEALDVDGAVVGLIGRTENSGTPFWMIRVANGVTDTMRVFSDSIQILFGGAYRAVWHTGTAPEATDAEADAGSVGAARMWSPARLWRAVRAALPLVTQSVAEAGTDTVARSWSALRVWQAIRAALPIATNAQIDAGTDTVLRSFSVANIWRAARTAKPSVAMHDQGGNEDNGLDTFAVVRLSSSFVAVAPLVIAEASCSLRTMTNSENPVGFGAIGIFGVTEDAYMALSTEQVSTFTSSPTGEHRTLSRSIAAANLIPGRTYQIRLLLRCNLVNRLAPSGMVISGINT